MNKHYVFRPDSVPTETILEQPKNYVHSYFWIVIHKSRFKSGEP